MWYILCVLGNNMAISRVFAMLQQWKLTFSNAVECTHMLFFPPSLSLCLCLLPCVYVCMCVVAAFFHICVWLSAYVARARRLYSNSSSSSNCGCVCVCVLCASSHLCAFVRVSMFFRNLFRLDFTLARAHLFVEENQFFVLQIGYSVLRCVFAGSVHGRWYGASAVVAIAS